MKLTRIFYLRVLMLLFFQWGLSSATSAQSVINAENDTIFIFENDSLVSFDSILWGHIEQDSIVRDMNNHIIGMIDLQGKYYDSESGEFAHYDPVTGNIILIDDTIGGTYISNELKDKNGNLLFRFESAHPVKIIGLMLFYFR